MWRYELRTPVLACWLAIGAKVLIIRNIARSKQRACLAQRLQKFELRELDHSPGRHELAAHSVRIYVRAPGVRQAMLAILERLLSSQRLGQTAIMGLPANSPAETRRAMELLNPKDMPKINAAPLPNGSWNVRNFGWSPLIEGPVHGTVTRRAVVETAAVVDFINANFLAK